MKDLNVLVKSTIQERLVDSVENVFDVSKRCMEELNVDLYDNQIEIVENVCDLDEQYLVILESRGGGKTFSVAVGLILLALDIPNFNIGVFAPKEGQSTRLLKEVSKILKDSKVKNKINWNKSSSLKIVFKNESAIMAFSGSVTANIEGPHFHVIVIDEAHKVADLSISQKILPMLGSFSSIKIIKLGVSLYKNHFHKSFKDPKYKKLFKTWTQCPLLLNAGSINVNGEEYSKYIVDIMPLKKKIEYFPNNPELHYEGDIDESDFETQYELKWIDAIDLFLNEDDQKFLIGEHTILEKGNDSDEYYFGLDTAPGSLVGSVKTDYTSLSIWRKVNGIKEKVKAYEWQGDPLNQIEEIFSIVHPIDGLFKCKFGIVEYTNLGIAILELMKKEKVPCAGILANQREKNSGKNYKNAMFYHFRFELRANRIKFPDLDTIENNFIMNKHLRQWCAIEEKINPYSINNRIEAPKSVKDSEQIHDDGCISDVCAVFCSDKSDSFPKSKRAAYKIPSLKTGPSLISRLNPSNKGKYL